MAKTTNCNKKLMFGLVGLCGIALSACIDDSGIGVLEVDGGETNTTTVTQISEVPATITVTTTVTGTTTVAPPPTATVTATTTATITRTTTPTTTVTATTTGTATGPTGTLTTTATVTATTAPTVTMTTTATVTATTTATVNPTATTTSTSTSTAVTTGTYTQTITQLGTYNDYTLVRRSLPPLWSCPANVGVGGAGGSSTASATPTEATLAASDCKSLAELRRPILKAQAASRLDQARASMISTYCSPRSETVCLDKSGVSVSTYNCNSGYAADAGVWRGYGGAASMGGSSGIAGSAGTSGTGGSTGATTYSTTNTQVESVDEADYIKNDGNTIFVLSSDGLHVVDAWPAAETREVAHLSLPGSPRRMFLLDNRLVVYTRLTSNGTPGSAGYSNPSDQGCTYGYDCRFSSEGGRTQILVYDVTNPASPTELMRYEMSGGYVASRRIGSNVYTVVHDSGATEVAGLTYSFTASSYDDMEARYAQILAANNAKIDASTDDFFLPWITMTKPGGSATSVAPCEYALATQFSQGGSFVSVNTFDLTTLGAPTRTLLASNAGYVYASASTLYMAVDRLPEQTYTSSYYYSSHQANDSFVHKFRLDGLKTEYAGSVTLPGHILNQFAMDEFEGVLRVASTKGWVPSANVSSYLTTYGVQAGKLVQLGQIGGIAPQEDIRSVRFDGTRGYVVTFKKTDPLFVFDLTDAANPLLTGELLIPGFSTYMHPLDETHILAIGFMADEMGSFAYFNGIQIQIFDVSVLSDPKVLWKKEIGTRGSNSEALTNHLAFNYFAPKKMLALPITVCEGGGDGSYGKLTFAGLMAFDVSLETGIEEHGRMPFLDPAEVAATTECNKWWTDSKSLVKRSIFMDDFVYGLSDAQLRVAGLDTMSSVLASVPLVSQ